MQAGRQRRIARFTVGVVLTVGVAVCTRVQHAAAEPIGAIADSITGAERKGSAPNASHNEIEIADFKFGPSTLRVTTGTKVVFINNDEIPHLIVSTQHKFKSSTLLDTHQRFTITLTKPGTYDYFCSLHPAMQGRIIVQPPS
jgi:plastocyanin